MENLKFKVMIILMVMIIIQMMVMKVMIMMMTQAGEAKMVLFSLELHCFTGLSHKIPTGGAFSLLLSHVSLSLGCPYQSDFIRFFFRLTT